MQNQSFSTKFKQYEEPTDISMKNIAKNRDISMRKRHQNYDISTKLSFCENICHFLSFSNVIYSEEAGRLV